MKLYLFIIRIIRINRESLSFIFYYNKDSLKFERILKGNFLKKKEKGEKTWFFLKKQFLEKDLQNRINLNELKFIP